MSRIDMGALANMMFDNTVMAPARTFVGEAVDSGRVAPAQADDLARDLQRELDSTGMQQSDANALLRESARRPPTGAELAERIGELRKGLHDAYGAAGEQHLAEAHKWLQQRAPAVSAGFGNSAAASDRQLSLALVQAYLRGRAAR